MQPQDHVPSSTFHGPAFKQQKYGHRQSLDGGPVLFNCMHTSQRSRAISCIFYLMTKRPPAKKLWTAVIAVEILVG
jgi:hypothetical protein